MTTSKEDKICLRRRVTKREVASPTIRKVHILPNPMIVIFMVIR